MILHWLCFAIPLAKHSAFAYRGRLVFLLHWSHPNFGFQSYHQPILLRLRAEVAQQFIGSLNASKIVLQR